jgi:hypothetical protein
MDADNKIQTGSDLPVDVIESVQTAAVGTNYAALPNIPGSRIVRFVNPSSDIEVREVGGTKTVKFAASVESVMYVSQNANQLEIRRVDTSNTQITVALIVGKFPV